MVLQAAEVVKIETEEPEKILDAIDTLRDIEGIERVILVTRDGIPMPSVSDRKVNILAAIAATILATAETVEAILGKGLPEQVIVETKQGKLFIKGAGHKVLLVVIAKPEANIQLVGIEIERAVIRIKEVLGEKEEYGRRVSRRRSDL